MKDNIFILLLESIYLELSILYNRIVAWSLKIRINTNRKIINYLKKVINKKLQNTEINKDENLSKIIKLINKLDI